MEYKWEYKPGMTPEEFEAANTEYLQNRWIDEHPELGYMINDGDLEKYYNDIDWDDIMDTMIDLYAMWLDDF